MLKKPRSLIVLNDHFILNQVQILTLLDIRTGVIICKSRNSHVRSVCCGMTSTSNVNQLNDELHATEPSFVRRPTLQSLVIPGYIFFFSPTPRSLVSLTLYHDLSFSNTKEEERERGKNDRLLFDSHV